MVSTYTGTREVTKEEKKKIIETIISMVWKQELHNIVHFSLIFIGKEMDG